MEAIWEDVLTKESHYWEDVIMDDSPDDIWEDVVMEAIPEDVVMEALSEDVVRKCLVKMPYTSHNTLKTVCHNWKALLYSRAFYGERKKFGTSEHLLCFIQKEFKFLPKEMFRLVVTVYDPVKDTWGRLPPIDVPPNTKIPFCCSCVAVNRKLLLIGGFEFIRRVYIYDFRCREWRRGANMPTARKLFACSVSFSVGLVYVAGGIDLDGNPLSSAEAYDVEKDEWEILPPMIEAHGNRSRGGLVEGKFMVLDDDGERAEVFDPCEGTWRRAHFRGGLVISSSSGGGELYVFTKHQQVEKYDVEKDIWSVVSTIPIPHDIGFSFRCGTQWRDQFFVSGVGQRDPPWPEKHISYLFNMSTRQLIELHGYGGERFDGLILSAATVEI